MGTIDIFAKWDLEKNGWTQSDNLKDIGRSFAIASYKRIINDNGKINYIIIDQGSRVEDHSKDFSTIKETEVRIDNVISHYERCNGNYDIKLFLIDADAPIIEDAKLFANYVESLALLPDTNSVNIIGLSKCSVMNFYVPRFFKNSETFKKTNVYNIASPYDGTKFASPKMFFPEIKSFAEEIIRKFNPLDFNIEKIEKKLYDVLTKNVYEGISSNSHMDYDIAIPGGIPDERIHLYDENFIKNVFCTDNVEAVKRLNSFKNILTSIDSNVRITAIMTGNIYGIALCLFDKMFFDGKSDGMVYTFSQRKVEDVLDIKSYSIKSHHDVTSNIRAFNEVLGIVDDTIDEFDDKNKILTRGVMK